MTDPSRTHGLSFTHVLFDLDGTLIDHFNVIYRCYVHTQERLGLPPATYEKVKATVGGSIPVTMRRLIGEAGDLDEALRLFREEFDRTMLDDITVLPGTEWLLTALRGEGKTLAVLTNKDGPAARAVLKHLGLDTFFSTIYGAVDTPWRKPQPELTRRVLDDLDADPASTLLIGDSPFDIATAHNAQLACAVVATGSHTEAQLNESEPAADWVCANFPALARRVFGLEPEAASPHA